MDQTIDTLIEITHSAGQNKYKNMFRIARGGVNVCYGIRELEKKIFIQAAQIVGQTIADTIAASRSMLIAVMPKFQ